MLPAILSKGTRSRSEPRGIPVLKVEQASLICTARGVIKRLRHSGSQGVIGRFELEHHWLPSMGAHTGKRSVKVSCTVTFRW